MAAEKSSKQAKSIAKPAKVTTKDAEYPEPKKLDATCVSTTAPDKLGVSYKKRCMPIQPICDRLSLPLFY